MILVILVSSLIIFYWEKLIFVFSDFDKFLALFLNASQLHSFNLLFLFKSLLISIVGLIVELFFVGWENSSLNRIFKVRSKSTVNDLYCYFFSITKLFEFFSFIFTFGIFYFVISLIVKTINFDITLIIPNKILQFIFVMILSDFVDYVRHRFNHLKHFWELHAYHHSATEFNLITTSRGSIFEAAFNSIFYALVFIIVGASFEPIIFFVITREWYVHMLHSNVKWDLGLLGKFIFISPLDHQLHHSIEKEDYDKNFGLIFVWWDKIFGTYKRNVNRDITYGIPDNYFNDLPFFKAQFNALKLFFKSF